MAKWYSFRARDRSMQGFCPADNEDGVCRFASRTRKELVIKPAIYGKNGFAMRRATMGNKGHRAKVDSPVPI